MNFPVEENAADMSTRQIGWEKRKRVKEATSVTAATAKREVLASSWIRLSIFSRFFSLAFFLTRVLCTSCILFRSIIHPHVYTLFFSHISKKGF